MTKISEVFSIKRHDTLPVLDPLVKGFQQNPDGATVTFSMQKLNSLDAPAVLDAPCPDISGSILDTDPNSPFYNTYSCILQYSWQSGDTDVEGSYKGEFEVSPLSGGKITVPDSEHCLLRIEILEDINDT